MKKITLIGILIAILLFVSSIVDYQVPLNDKALEDIKPSNLQVSTTTHEVLAVVDGDTIRINLYSETTTVRIIGIDTPEVSSPYTEQECFGIEASQKMKELVQGRSVYLMYDESQDRYDIYGRLLAHVFMMDDRNIGALMVAEGFAREYTFKYPHYYSTEYKVFETSAKKEGLGMWKQGVCD